MSRWSLYTQVLPTLTSSSRLVRNKWIRRRSRPHARNWRPALEEAEKDRLQRQLKVLQLRWAEQQMLRSVQRGRRENEAAGGGAAEEEKASAAGAGEESQAGYGKVKINIAATSRCTYIHKSYNRLVLHKTC